MYELTVIFENKSELYFEVSHEDLVDFINVVDDDVCSKFYGFTDHNDGTICHVDRTKIITFSSKVKEDE